jgi:hypothetical protein
VQRRVEGALELDRVLLLGAVELGVDGSVLPRVSPVDAVESTASPIVGPSLDVTSAVATPEPTIATVAKTPTRMRLRSVISMPTASTDHGRKLE